MDSAMLLNTPIERLGKNIEARCMEKFKLIGAAFQKMTENQFTLLGKQLYPYDYMDSWSMFDQPQLPPKEEFFNKLQDKQF